MVGQGDTAPSVMTIEWLIQNTTNVTTSLAWIATRSAGHRKYLLSLVYITGFSLNYSFNKKWNSRCQIEVSMANDRITYIYVQCIMCKISSTSINYFRKMHWSVYKPYSHTFVKLFCLCYYWNTIKTMQKEIKCAICTLWKKRIV